jgi:ABC-2 type transport system ATP-binding protein
LGASLRNLVSRKKLVREAVRGVSFFDRARRNGRFLGPNGAGKTTTLKMLSGIMHLPRGEPSCWPCALAAQKEFRMRISIVMGQRSQLWPDLTRARVLCAQSRDLRNRSEEIRARVGELVEHFGVEDFLKLQVRRLSLENGCDGDHRRPAA